VYAERQELSREERMTFTVDVRSGDPNYVISVRDRDDKPVRDLLLVADLAGPRNGIESAKAALLRSVATPAVQVVVDPPKEGGRADVPILAQVEGSNVFRDNGVSLSNVSPGVIRVFADPIREESVEVSPPDALANNIDTFVPTPLRVTVRGPASVLARAAPLKVTPDLSNVPSVTAQGLRDAPVPLVVAGVTDGNVTVVPSSVKLSLTLRAAEAAGKIPFGIPVSLSIPPGLADDYKVELVSSDSVTNVAITGPADAVRALEAGTFTPQPTATLRIERGDVHPTKLGEVQERAVRLDLPKDVRHAGDPTIKFRVTRRTADQ
jgi:hypothetical protein